MFDIRRIQVHTLKEFFKEFAMIVIGILTAITIEHQYTQSHKRHLAELAAKQVHNEIASNLKSVDESLKMNKQAILGFNELEGKIVKALESTSDREKLNANLEQIMDGHYSIGVSAVEPAQDAWDAAIASQAVTQMHAKELQAFSKLYAKQRVMNNDLLVFQQGMRNGLWMRWNGVITDLQFHRVDGIELLKVLREFVGGLDVLNKKMQAYRSELQAVEAPHN